jgi:hypothetical protein
LLVVHGPDWHQGFDVGAVSFFTMTLSGDAKGDIRIPIIHQSLNDVSGD